MTSEKRAQKFYTDDASLPRSRLCFWLVKSNFPRVTTKRSTTQIWVVTRHQYSISALVSQTLFGVETSGSAAKCRMSSQDMTRDVLWSARKIDENYFFFGIQTGDKLAKTSFFVAFSRLFRHGRNLAERGCLLSRFHFTLCGYFLGHVACRKLPWQRPHLICSPEIEWSELLSVRRSFRQFPRLFTKC